MRAHTATHLLHAELTAIFPQTKQAGSLVDEDYLRFDFYADRLLSDQEVQAIETNINQIIHNAHAVSIQEMPKPEAEKLWAKMFFEDKYGDTVRVVSIKNQETRNKVEQVVSIELCGGTHVENTKDIGVFVIVWQQAVASGIKRITAYTGPKVLEFIQEKNTLLAKIAEKLEGWVGQIEERLGKLVSESKTLESKLQATNMIVFEDILNNKLESKTMEGVSYNYFDLNTGVTASWSTKDVSDYLKIKKTDATIVFIDGNSGFLIRSSDGSAKKLMGQFGWKGGGSDTMCQGKII
jgi:alanyl-tRNA synthetase